MCVGEVGPIYSFFCDCIHFLPCVFSCAGIALDINLVMRTQIIQQINVLQTL